MCCVRMSPAPSNWDPEMKALRWDNGLARKIWAATSWDKFPCWLGRVSGQSPAGNQGSERTVQEEGAGGRGAMLED